MATEAGWSTGALRHYFGTKEALLGAAAALMEERVIGRFEHQRYDGPPREAVRRVLCEVLPLDEDRRTEGELWFAFAARSLVDPKIAGEYGLVFDGVRELCGRIIGQMADGGWLVSGLDPDVEATRLHALVDGLAIHGLMKRLDEEAMMEVLNSHLARIIVDP